MFISLIKNDIFAIKRAFQISLKCSCLEDNLIFVELLKDSIYVQWFLTENSGSTFPHLQVLNQNIFMWNQN